MPLAGGAILRQEPIYLTKNIRCLRGAGTVTTDVSSYNLGPNAAVIGGGMALGYFYSTAIGGAYLSLNVQLTADRQTLNWNFSNNGWEQPTLSGLGAVILDFV